MTTITENQGKVINFMSDVDVELWKLGIPSKTRHNEVAPNQFEVAPLFSVANLASDQNQIIMETIEKTALKTQSGSHCFTKSHLQE